MRLTFPVRRIADEIGGGVAEVTTCSSSSWRSAVFEGTRHELTMRWRGEEEAGLGVRMLALLDEDAIDVPGHKVTEVAVLRSQLRASPPLLTATVCVDLLKDGC
jgi:hypothetical protein